VKPPAGAIFRYVDRGTRAASSLATLTGTSQRSRRPVPGTSHPCSGESARRRRRERNPRTGASRRVRPFPPGRTAHPMNPATPARWVRPPRPELRSLGARARRAAGVSGTADGCIEAGPSVPARADGPPDEPGHPRPRNADGSGICA
jgi:hypothetical protein